MSLKKQIFIVILFLASCSYVKLGLTAELLIQYQAQGQRASIVTQNSMVSNTLENSQIQVLEVPESDLELTRNHLVENPNILHVEENEEIHAHFAPNDEFFSHQWFQDSLELPQVWNQTHSAEKILIAVIDSGVDLNHPDLVQNLWKNPHEIPKNGIDDDGNGYVDDVVGYDFLNRDGDPQDDYGHGTSVFGEIAATGNNQIGVSGIVWNAEVMVLKVLNSKGDSNLSTAIEAIHYAIAHEAKIINISWGYVPNTTPSEILKEALQKAADKGILVVASAGNGYWGTPIDNDLDSSKANYPSSYKLDNMISVAATNSQDQLADFSDYGQTTVHLAAPGVEIFTTALHSSYNYFTGTSAAAPLVTGSAALIWSENPSLNFSQIKRLLLETTDAVSALKDKVSSGGRLNTFQALNASPAFGGKLLENVSSSISENIIPNGGESGGGGCSLSSNDSQLNSTFIVIYSIICVGIWIFKKQSLIKDKT
ncbi:MAG: S8 family serine peptidase [Deltaproteobacteria bacterium]|nr:S8 family serine peptidase [Deltaproteobacteria bacterium]